MRWHFGLPCENVLTSSLRRRSGLRRFVPWRIRGFWSGLGTLYGLDAGTIRGSVQYNLHRAIELVGLLQAIPFHEYKVVAAKDLQFPSPQETGPKKAGSHA